MKTTIEWHKGVKFIAKTGSGNNICMDGPVDSGGNNEGARPTELLISGVGGCTSFDVITMANAKKIEIEKYFLEVEAYRPEAKLSKITTLHLTYNIKTKNINKESLENIIKLSVKKQCSCCLILNESVEITYKLRMI